MAGLVALFANRRCTTHFLREFPLSTASASLLPKPGLVLHFCPLVPRKISCWRLVAGLERRLHANDAARDLYAGHGVSFVIFGQHSRCGHVFSTLSLTLTLRRAAWVCGGHVQYPTRCWTTDTRIAHFGMRCAGGFNLQFLGSGKHHPLNLA